MNCCLKQYRQFHFVLAYCFTIVTNEVLIFGPVYKAAAAIKKKAELQIPFDLKRKYLLKTG